jgi:hypothetical protein
MTEVRAQMTTASALAKTPAGRIAFAGELAGQGLITSDEYRTILDHPDVDGVLSLYVAAYEDVERCIEEIFEGATLTPEPYQNLKMIVWRGQHHYLKAQNEGAPEEDLERLRQWVVIAAHMLSLAEPANEMPQPGAPPVMAPAAPAVLPPAAAA